MAAVVQWGAGGDDSDNEFDEAEARFSGKTALLVVIDCSSEMFEQWGDENEETPFLSAIKCCESMWRSKVVSNAKDVVGILLLGTEKQENPSGFKNLYLLQGLSSVKVGMIKQLVEIRNSPEDLNGFKDKIGSSEQYDLKHLFWLGKILFDEAKTQNFAKKVILFTCNDNPHANQPMLQQDAIGKFKDLGKVEFNIVSFKEEFDFTKFYSRILEDEASIIYSSKLDSLMKVVRMKQKLRRPLTRATLEILPGVTIGVGYYSFVRPAPHPRYVNINRRNNEIIEKTTNVFRADSGVPILKSEERKVINVQGEVAVFTNQELKEIKYNVGKTGMKLIGFLNEDQFDHLRWYRSPGYFLYPDEDSIAGSKDFFTALLKRCHILKKIPLVTMVLSRGKTPKLACLLPSVPEVNEQGEEVHQIFPQGFHVFLVPYSDEIRKMDFQLSDTPAPGDMVQIMEKVVKKLTYKKFDVLEVKNPQLQSKWKKLEEEALEEEVTEEDFCDLSEPNEELMSAKLGDLPMQIEQTAARAGTWFSTTKAVHSKAKVDIEVEAKHGRLNRCTVAVMKEFLDQKKVPYDKFIVKANIIKLVNQVCGIPN